MSESLRLGNSTDKRDGNGTTIATSCAVTTATSLTTNFTCCSVVVLHEASLRSWKTIVDIFTLVDQTEGALDLDVVCQITPAINTRDLGLAKGSNCVAVEPGNTASNSGRIMQKTSFLADFSRVKWTGHNVARRTMNLLEAR